MKQPLPAVMVGIDQDVGPRSRYEARDVSEVIRAMVTVYVGKADFRPVAPSSSPLLCVTTTVSKTCI